MYVYNIIVNGRGNPQFDNFTSVSSRGKAVVDYCITSYTHLDHVANRLPSVFSVSVM